MRPELHNIEIIESYLQGKMPQDLKAAFENEMNDSQELRESIEVQQLVQQAVVRKGIKMKVQQFAPSATSNFSLWKRLRFSIYLSSFLLVSAATWFCWPSADVNPKTVTQGKQVLVQTPASAPVLPEALAPIPPLQSESQTECNEIAPALVASHQGISSELDGLKTWVDAKRQYFHLSPNESHTLECDNGTLIIVPKNAFCDTNGDTIDKLVQLEVVEALNMADMIAYNLTTMNDGKALSSGGMIYIQPTVEGEKVQIRKERPLHIEIPTETIQAGMLAWKGEVNEKGDINWVQPKVLEKFLIPVDFQTLDFLPTGFANAVETGIPYKNHKVNDENLQDSLYYSLFSNHYSEEEIAAPKKDFGLNIGVKKLGLGSFQKEAKGKNNFTKSQQVESSVACYIDPLTIKTIRTKPYSNTFLATKEFEDRLKALHEIKYAQTSIDLYLNNLTKKLWEVDQLVANQLTGKDKAVFQAFADQKLTNVENLNIHQEELKTYYNVSRKKYQQEVSAARKAYQAMSTNELAALSKELQELSANYFAQQNAGKNQAQNTGRLISIGKNRAFSIPQNTVASMNSYKVNWYSSGWMNIDEYLHLLGNNDVVAKITDPSKKSGAKIYQCINTLKTVITLIQSKDLYEAHFPEKGAKGALAMQDTYCVGIHKDDETIQYAEKRYNPYTEKNVELQWNTVSETQLYIQLQRLSPANAVIVESLKNEQEEIAKATAYQKEANRINAEMQAIQDRQQKEAQFVSRLLQVVDPCASNALFQTAPATNTIKEFSLPEPIIIDTTLPPIIKRRLTVE